MLESSLPGSSHQLICQSAFHFPQAPCTKAGGENLCGQTEGLQSRPQSPESWARKEKHCRGPGWKPDPPAGPREQEGVSTTSTLKSLAVKYWACSWATQGLVQDRRASLWPNAGGGAGCAQADNVTGLTLPITLMFSLSLPAVEVKGETACSGRQEVICYSHLLNCSNMFFNI